MTSRYDAYCGLYCGACPVLAANERGELELYASDLDRSPADLECRGCKTDVNAVFCLKCPIRACARERAVEFCSGCEEYPCEKVRAFGADGHAHHAVAVRGLERVVEIGPAAWLAEQRARWRCPGCGRRFTWYEETCPRCGSALRDVRAEAREEEA